MVCARRTMLFVVAAVLAIMHSGSLLAQRYNLDSYGPESGLVDVQVNDIAQDTLGYIWAATDKGLCRFDGLTTFWYHRNKGLSEEYCNTVFCDSDNRIWVGHRSGGISLVVGDSVRTFTEADGLANNEVHDIFQDREGAVWAATFGGASVFEGEKWTTINKDDGLVSNNVHSISQDSIGRMWLGTYGSGINVIEGGSIELISTRNGLINNYVTHISRNAGSMVIGTLGGLTVWEKGSFRNTTTANGLINNQVNMASTAQNGDLWLATYNGVNRVRNADILSITEENGLLNNEVLSIFCDAEADVWIGTAKGLVKLKDQAFSHFFSTEDIDIDPTSIFRDGQNRLWVGNEQGGVLRFDGTRFVNAFDDSDVNDHQISSIAEDGDGNIWFGTMDFGGLFEWYGKQLYVYSDDFGLVDNNINCLLRDEDGNLLIGTPSGLSLFDGIDFRPVPLSDGLSGIRVTAMEKTEDGVILIGTGDGTVFSLRDGQVDQDTGLTASSAITDICESPFGTVFSTASNGIFIWKDGKKRVLSPELSDHLSSARSVAFCDNGLFIGTANGLIKADISTDTGSVLKYLRTDGFPGTACKQGSLLADGNGLWIGTSMGITRLVPSEEQPDLRPPTTLLERLQLFYKDVNWESMGFDIDQSGLPINLELPYTENYLRFRFKGIDQRNPEKVAYRWTLEGFDKNWNPYTGQQQANYPNLPPGEYVFKLMACNGGGICNEAPLTFAFRIRPPFWRTIGFYLFLAFLAMAVTYAYIKMREKKLIEEKQILESTVLARTKELREQKEIVEKQNTHITESIEYASNIQRAILPSEEELIRAFRDHFIFYRPKETVGGDFYWVYSIGDVSWAAAVDCTGHGVSGAFMSMIGSDLLNQIIIEKQVKDPAKVLEEMDKGIKLAFAQSAKEFESDQGMDVALIRIDRKKQMLDFAGAQRPLFIMAEGKMTEIEGDKLSISCADSTKRQFFTLHSRAIQQNSMVYLFSDGLADQFGGPKGKKFMMRRLREFLISNSSLDPKAQLEELAATFTAWTGDSHDQVDDVMLFGIQM